MVRKKGTTDDLLKQPEADLVVKYAIDRKKKGLYTLIFVAGLPGTGKTSTCFRLGELIYLKYTGENRMKADNVVDSFLELTKFVMNANPNELNIAVIEEVSVLFPSRRAMSGGNVDLGQLLDTCRKKQVILLANAPIWTTIDSHMKALGNVYIQTKKIYKMAAIVYSKMYRLQTDPRTGKTYTHSLKRMGREVKKMYTRMPNQEEWDLYESKKDSFMETLYMRLEAREKMRIDKENRLCGIKTKKLQVRPLTPRELQVYELVHREKMTYREAGEKLGISAQAIGMYNKNIREKMMIIEPSKQIPSKKGNINL